MAPDPQQQQHNLALLVYLLQLLSILFGITAIIGILINHVKFGELKDSLAGTHFRWQIVTFWLGLAVAAAGWLTGGLLGRYLFITAVVWLYYRAIRGLYCLFKRRPAPLY
ncbi:MAG: hypothetical protein KDJ38_07585 [Gammaproteobacteria bacterium]|nr:hypothetical protein [Gammaproteobacteria bacterium]